MRTRLPSFVWLLIGLGFGCGAEPTLSDDDASTSVSAIAVPGGSPSLSLGTVVATPISGDGDSNLDPGEAAELDIPLINAGGAGNAAGVSATLSTTSSKITIDQGSKTSAYPDISPGSTQVNSTPYVVRVLPEATCGESLSLSLTVTYQGGSQTLTVPLVLANDSGSGRKVRFSSGNVNVPIPDLLTAELTMTTSGLGSSVLDVNVTVRVLHPCDFDLRFELASPSGRRVTLINHRGNIDDNFWDTTLDDAAATAISEGIAPFTGTFRPESPLSAFNDDDANGQWKLFVHDDAGNDSGTVVSWSLELTAGGRTLSSEYLFQPIPDQGSMTSSLTSELSGSLLDVNVTLAVDHPSVSDLYVQLESPSGTMVDLIKYRGGSGQDFYVTGLNDAAATAISAGTAPFRGTYRPESPLSAFNGEQARGTWTLHISDDVAGNTGTLELWRLALRTCTDCSPIPIAPDTQALPSGIVDIPYSQTLSVPGGSGGYVFAVEDPLPAWLSLSSAGLLSGTPTQREQRSFRVDVSDHGRTDVTCEDHRDYTLYVAAHVELSPSTLPDATGSHHYEQQISATGGTGPYGFAVTSGALPGGLTLSGGLLSGAPTAAGDFSFTITATDANNDSGALSYSLHVDAPTITLSPTTLPAGVGSNTYAGATLSAAGGAGPYTFAVTNGALPAGLALSAAGVISGTPTEAGSFSPQITATDANGFPGSRAYTLTVTAPTITLSPKTLTTAEAYSSSMYRVALSATGGAAPYTFTVAPEALPPGVLLVPQGVLLGTPTATGSFKLNVTATDANGFTGTQQYTLLVSPPTITVGPATLPGFVAGSAYGATLSATGGAEPYSFAVSKGTLPVGLTLAAGIISGIPTETGSVSFEVTATDAHGFTGHQSYTMGGNAPLIAVTPATLADVVALEEVSVTFNAAGGQGPYSFAVTSGALPEGLSLSAAGTLSGSASKAGDFAFTIAAKDANSFTGSVALTLHVAAPAMHLKLSKLPDSITGGAYSVTLQVEGGSGPYVFSISQGSLPAGMSLSPEGVLSGTAPAVGEYALTVKVQDQHGFTLEQALTLHVTALLVSPQEIGALTGGVAFSQTLSVVGGVEPYSFSVDASKLPPGLTLSSAGVLAGTPTAAGEYPFTVTVKDANGLQSTTSYTVTVNAPAIAITPSVLAEGREGQAYGATLEASGGVAPYTFTVQAGTLPTGMELSTAGVLSGTPAAATVVTITVKATDANGFSGQQEYTLTIVSRSALQVAPELLTEAKVGQAYEATLTASGGAGSYVFSISAGALPPGLALSSEGKLSGTPTEAGQVSFTVKVKDSENNEGTREYTLKVASAAVTPDGGPKSDAGTTPDAASPASEDDNGGCSSSCNASPAGGRSVGWLPLSLLLLVGWCWRRRRA